jgi:hypothetical protein
LSKNQSSSTESSQSSRSSVPFRGITNGKWDEFGAAASSSKTKMTDLKTAQEIV